MSDDVMTAVEALRRAVLDAGPRPTVHFLTLQKHRREWPALWMAIEHLLEATDPIARGNADG
jgi:hypothetical protein